MRLKRRTRIIALVLFAAAIITVLIPSFMKTANKIYVKGIVGDFDEVVEHVQPDMSYEEAKEEGLVDDEGYLIDKDTGQRESEKPVIWQYDVDRLYKDSLAYNNALVNNGQNLSEHTFQTPALDLEDYGIFSGVYAYISIPDADVDIPVYLGATNYNMSIGATHLGGTSLPIGGEMANCVIAGHNGYTGRTYFDYISYLDVGSSVFIKNYFYTLEYEVIDVRKIDPYDTNGVYLYPQRDILTLLTCAEMGRERWQVTCERKS